MAEITVLMKRKVELFKKNNDEFFIGKKIGEGATVNYKCRGCNSNFLAFTKDKNNMHLADQIARSCCYKKPGYRDKLTALTVGDSVILTV